MTGVTRMTGMTWLQGSYPVLNKNSRTFEGLISHSSKIPVIDWMKSLFWFFHNMTAILIFILKVFLCLLLLGI